MGLSSPAAAQRGNQKLDRALATASAADTGVQRVIVRTVPGARGAVRDRLAAGGHRVKGEHASIDALSLDMPSTALAGLAADPNVLSISSDAVVTPTGSPASSQPNATGPGFLRATLGLDSSSPTGKNVGVAIIDSGVQPSVDLAGNIAAFFDLTGGTMRQRSAYDDYGHGTHVAGLIAGDGTLSGGQYAGVAPDARLTIFKVLDATGQGRTSDVIAAIEYIVANQQRLHIDIINLSIGHPILEPAASDPLVQAIEQATRAGLVVVVAAGNCGINPVTGEPGYAGITSPGNAPSAITVGALLTQGTPARSDDQVAPFSSRGPSWYDALAKPDIVAPGDRLVSNGAVGSTLYTSYPSLRVTGTRGGQYLRLSGTSMATAVTTGVVALAMDAASNGWGQGSSLSANTIKAILQYSAFPVHDGNGAEYDTLTEGGGGLNAAGAIQMADAVNTGARYGSPWISPVPMPSTTIAGETLLWEQNIVWGVWQVPGSVLLTNAPCWGNNIVWGVSDGQNIVWGTKNTNAQNIVWGVSTDNTNAQNIVWGVNDMLASGAIR